MKKLLMAIMAIGCLLTSCSENIYDSMAGGDKVSISLSYQELVPEEVNVTRASTNENALNNLQIFVFNENKDLIGYKWIDSDLKQDGTKGDVVVKTKAGNCYIYGVANVNTALYSLSSEKTMIPTTSSEAWNEEDAQDGGIKFSLDDFKVLTFNRVEGEYDITEANFMMSGVANNGNTLTIDKKGNVSGSSTLIELKRIVSKVKVRVAAGSSAITFTPSSYEVRNVPQKGALIYDANKVLIEPSGFEPNPYTNLFVANNQETENSTTYDTFSMYLPENRQNQNLTATISTWKDREKDNGDTEPDKEFTNAPENATYVVIKGKYKGPLSTTNKAGDDSKDDVDGDVTYFVHLGNFDKDIADFNVERNYDYTYTITINGLNDLWVEVEAVTQDNGSSEGLVFKLENEKIFDLDSHYGQVELTFSNTDVTTDEKDSKTKYIYFMAKDVYDDTSIMKISSSDSGNTFTFEQGNDKKEVDASDIEKMSSLSWVEFYEGSDVSYSNLFSNGKKTKALSLIDVLKALIKKAYSSDSWQVTYTCFVNENYYENKNWSEFVNQNQRYVYICRDIVSSKDVRNVRGAVIYGVRQYSIQTFYNTDYGDGGSDDIIAYGCEVDYDDNYGGKARKSANKKTIENWTQGSEGSDSFSSWDGLANMRTDLNAITINSSNKWDLSYTSTGWGWGTTTTTDYYTYAKYACMSRNRDNDGDGVIDNDEVRWYCPTMQQYTGLWIGNEGIPESKARIFSGNKDNITIKDYWVGDKWYANRSKPAIHYYSNDGSTRFYWAEEGGSVGSTYYSDVEHAVRCVRNLQSQNNGSYESGNSVTAEKYYDPAIVR